MEYLPMELSGTGEYSLEKKIWWRILPFVFLLFAINILDRTNISYAALTMNADLGIDPWMFGIISGIFFIGYLLFEIPSNQILARVGARLWLTRIMVTWGFVVILMAFVRTPVELGVLRFLLGIAEAGFFPGIILYLSFWFRENDIARCYGFFIAAMPFALVSGSPVSAWIIQSVDWFGLAGWRWVFLIEGILAVIVGILTLFILPSLPVDASWLEPDEKQRLEEELHAEHVSCNMPRHLPLRELIGTPFIPVLTAGLFMLYFALFGLIFWLPQIVRSFNITDSVLQIGGILMLPFGAAMIALVLWGRHSDRRREQVWHFILPLLVAAAAFAADALVENGIISFLLLGIAVVGLFAATAPFWGITISSLSPKLRPAGTAFINSFASLGSFFGPVVFGFFLQHSGEYDTREGLFALGAALVFSCSLLLFIYKREKIMAGR
jgi:ACS family tartrate transporter-like MFS transporter